MPKQSIGTQRGYGKLQTCGSLGLILMMYSACLVLSAVIAVPCIYFGIGSGEVGGIAFGVGILLCCLCGHACYLPKIYRGGIKPLYYACRDGEYIEEYKINIEYGPTVGQTLKNPTSAEGGDKDLEAGDPPRSAATSSTPQHADNDGSKAPHAHATFEPTYGAI